MGTDADLQTARAELDGSNWSIVVVKDGAVLARKRGGGIAPLVELVDALGDELRGASVADSVFGKAAALISAGAGVAAVYAGIATPQAVQELASRGIRCAYGSTVEHILNRSRDDLCPFEKLAGEVDDPARLLERVRRFLGMQAP